MRIALDCDVLKLALESRGGDSASQFVSQLVRQATSVCVLPLVAEELESENNDSSRRWREAGFEEIADDFLKGCAAGVSKRYLDHHPDPRHCRLVAEAECAKMDLLVTRGLH